MYTPDSGFLRILTGEKTGWSTGDMTGNVTGRLTVTTTPGLTGVLTGYMTGMLTGNVTGSDHPYAATPAALYVRSTSYSVVRCAASNPAS
jgi:hypothetical protein